MKIEQIYTGCLAQGAYYITSNGEAAIIDPLREIEPYTKRLERDKVTLSYIFETHFHADFVSGHLDLSKKTSAPIVFGPNANPSFECILATDNQEFRIGNITLKVIHTPGHTLESTCYLLKDETGKEVALFSGDTLFLGDVGRPDLAQKSATMRQEELAGMLYDSIYFKILPLANEIIIYPAHGAGSACGKNMMKETVDSLGNQKKMNYALNQSSKENFIHAVLDGLLPPPSYFKMNVAMNKKGYESFENVFNNGMEALSAEEFEHIVEKSGALVLDTRNASEFTKNHIPQSINIGINGDFAPWVGALISNTKQSIILVTELGKEEESVTRLARVGFDNQIGHLKGGIQTWIDKGNEIDFVNRISALQFADEFQIGKSKIIDVRKVSEYANEHIDYSSNKPLANINDWVNEINNEEHFYLHCAGGYRSMMAASILQARGFRNFTEIEGGFAAISKTNIPKSDLICQNKVGI